MRQKSALVVDLLFSVLLFFIVFIAPLKFGMPTIEINKMSFPASRIEWIVSAWPNELFVCFIAVLCAFYLLRMLLAEKMTCGITPVDFPILLFAAAVLVSVALSVNKNISVLVAGELIAGAVMYHIAVNTPEKRELIIIALLSAATIVALYGIYQRFQGMEETRRWANIYLANDPALERVVGKLSSGRVFSTFVYPNALAGYLLTTIPLSLMIGIRRFFLDQPRARRGILRLTQVLSIFCAVSWLVLFEQQIFDLKTIAFMMGGIVLVFLSPLAQAAALLLSHSYGGLGAGLLVVMFALFVYDRKLCARVAMLLGAVLLAAFIYLLLFQRPAFVSAVKLASVKVRLEYFWSTIMMILRRPAFGFGPGTYGDVFARFKLFGGEETRFAHNNFLQVFAESGFFAFVGITCFWVFSWLRGFYIMKQNDTSRMDTAVRVGAFLGLTGFIIHSCIDFDLYVPGAALNAFILTAFIFQGEGRGVVIPLKGWRRKIPVAFAALVIPCASIMLFSGRLQAIPHFKSGMEAAQRGHFAKAAPAFEKAARLDRSSALYAFHAGLCYEKMGSPQEAIPLLKRAVALCRSTPQYHYELAKCYYMAGGYERKAESELKRAVKWYPKSTFYRVELAKFYEIVGQKGKALVEYLKIYNLDPSNRAARDKIDELKTDAGQ